MEKRQKIKIILMAIMALGIASASLFILASRIGNRSVVIVSPESSAVPDSRKETKTDTAVDETQFDPTVTNSNYLGSEYKGNYVWSGAMNLAWNDWIKNILHEKVRLDTNNKSALEMAKKFNEATISKNDLNQSDYYANSGFGHEAANMIYTESRQKFPRCNFSPYQLALKPEDIIFYTYFSKVAQFKHMFAEGGIGFKDQLVKGFYAENDIQKSNVKVIKYESNAKFIISLQLKDEGEQMFLAKGYDMKDPQEVIDEIKFNNPIDIKSHDHFSVPKLHFDYHRDYRELANSYFANTSLKGYEIGRMFEDVEFSMDEDRIREKSQASKRSSLKATAKLLWLDGPYWLIMKKVNYSNPYFIIGVNNAEFMECAKSDCAKKTCIGETCQDCVDGVVVQVQGTRDCQKEIPFCCDISPN